MDEVKLLPCDAELVEQLRAESLSLQRIAWSRLDGGQDCSISATLADRAADRIEALTRPTLVTDEVVERVARAIGTAMWGKAQADTFMKLSDNAHFRLMHDAAREAITVMPAIPPQSLPESLDAIPGSHPTGQAPSGLGASRFDPERVALAIERVGNVLNEVDYDCGHFITGDNIKIIDVQILHDLARAGA